MPRMRTAIEQLEGSRIRQVVNAALGQPDVLRFWFGESDEVTSPAVREAAVRSLMDGETFYNHNLGSPELRAAITGYMQRVHPQAAGLDESRIGATSSGVSALMLATQAIVDAGSRVVAVTPVWPNLIQQSIIMGAKVHDVPLQPVDGEWRLDLQRLLDAITPDTRMLIVNAPNNPTGWTLTRDEQQAILAHCRKTGTWILADEVYERLYYEPTPNDCAPSFLDIASADDRLVVAHSFSKTFLMTGWRLGWLVMPPALTPHVSKLIEFNTSCAPTFVQRAGIEAIRREPEITPALVQHFRRCRDTLVPLLQAVPGISVQPARGGMYAFFRIAGYDDSLPLAKQLVAEAGLGLAPGSAFTPLGQQVARDWLRWCFASRDVSRLEEGVARLRRWLGA
ncbi:MAG: pyridoxal phosphate-dependent aminotransferase [Burkholderiaceae bacterium]